MITDRRMDKFRKVAALRQDMTVVLENVHDPHNIGAVMRTCDSVGIQELYILYTDPRLSQDQLSHIKISSTGVRKWLHLHFFDNVADCFDALNDRYTDILATHLDKESRSIYDSKLTGTVAFVFGNEHEGVSDEALARCTGNVLIPQYGMVQSLNISVACAVTLYEAARQREKNNMYSEELSKSDDRRMSYFRHFIDKHK